MTHDHDDEDGVGYGRPPKHARFKPGQSGNPKGRPKGAKGIRTQFQEVAQMRVAVSIAGGRKVQRPLFQVAVQKMFLKAAEGDPKHMRLALDAARLFLEEGIQENAAPSDADDDEIMRAFVERLRGFGHGEEGGGNDPR